MAEAIPLDLDRSDRLSQLCASRSFWGWEKDPQDPSVAALQQCAFKACTTCAQFLDFFQIIFGPEDLPSELSFRRQISRHYDLSKVWDVVPKNHRHHVETIEITSGSDGFSEQTPQRSQQWYISRARSKGTLALFDSAGFSERTLPSTQQRYIGWTGNEGALALARSWIQDCINNHPDCEGYEPSALPDRVLDVSGRDVKLYESSNETAPYISLSHCWGKTKAECTTFKHNFEAQKQGIRWTTLPQTFKDAIKVTRALNIQYLWIDNVCIKQDSFEDWERQAVQMASIYSRGYITIAATASSSDEGGLFRTATNDHLGQLISIYEDTLRTTKIWIRAGKQKHWLQSPTKKHLTSYTGSLGRVCPPLLKRSWCYQERLLSSRLLNFDEWEISWSCGHGERCSCTASDPPKLNYSYQNTSQNTSQKPANIWRSMIDTYGSLELTNTRDKLPAIAGLAVRHSETLRNEDKYMAGIWSSSLICDMLWRVLADDPDEATPRPRPQDWRAPSWSWASSDSKIVYNLRSYEKPKSMVRVVEIHCEPCEQAPFSRFQENTYIVLSGTALPGRVLESGDPYLAKLEFTERYDILETLRLEPLVAIDIPLSEIAGQEVVLLLLARTEWKYLLYDYWLVLRTRSSANGNEVFERVGIYRCERRVPDTHQQKWPERAVKIF